MCTLLLTPSVPMFSNFSFFKNKVYKPINNKNPAPAKAIVDLWLSTRLNKEVKDSIPDFDESVVSIEVIRKEIGEDKIEEEYFDLDDILDKIAKHGLESLTEGEKDFLDKKSKEM